MLTIGTGTSNRFNELGKELSEMIENQTSLVVPQFYYPNWPEGVEVNRVDLGECNYKYYDSYSEHSSLTTIHNHWDKSLVLRISKKGIITFFHTVNEGSFSFRKILCTSSEHISNEKLFDDGSNNRDRLKFKRNSDINRMNTIFLLCQFEEKIEQELIKELKKAKPEQGKHLCLPNLLKEIKKLPKPEPKNRSEPNAFEVLEELEKRVDTLSLPS